MNRYRRLATLFSIALLSVLTIWFISDHLKENNEEKNSAKATHIKAMDELLAEDLSFTIQLFLHQLKEDLSRWKDSDLVDEKIKAAMLQEVREHEHVHGFSFFKKDKEHVTIGEIIDDPLQKLKNLPENTTLLSDPYVHKGKKRMLIGLKEKDTVFVAEVDLTFIEGFVKDVASLSDANGNFFVGGDDVDLSLSFKEADAPYAKVEVPDVGWNLYVQSKHDDEESHFKEGEAIVQLKEGVNKKSWLNEHDLLFIDDLNGMIIVRGKDLSTEQLLQKLTNDDEIVFAEPNYMFTKQTEYHIGNTRDNGKKRGTNLPFKGMSIPNDEFYHPYQWNLEQIFAEEGWEITVGKEAVPIAIIDSGVDPSHMDLEDKIIDGFNAFENNGAYGDDNGHGTHVAGIAAAITNNRQGVAGVSWDNPILAVKCLDENAAGNALTIAKGIIWAVDNGAKVINLSLGDNHHSELIYEAIKYAYDNDVVIVTASGNDNVGEPMYPAAYDEVLAVAAVNTNRERAFFSNYGNHIDVAAPGEHIPSTYMGNQYVVMSGTSMAAPHVTGLAGLIRSINPELTNEEVYDIIRKTSDDLGEEGFDPYYGYGEINIKNALKEVMSTRKGR